MSSSEFQAVSAETLRAWDNEHVWHPFTPMSAYVQEQSPIIARGEGFDLIDVEGHRYLDGISSLWCNVHGHTVPEIDAAGLGSVLALLGGVLGLVERRRLKLA